MNFFFGNVFVWFCFFALVCLPVQLSLIAACVNTTNRRLLQYIMGLFGPVRPMKWIRPIVLHRPKTHCAVWHKDMTNAFV